jgi:hypothetical protein
MPQFAAMDRKEGDVSKRRFAAMVERMVVGHMRARASRPQNAAVEICDEQEASKPQNATMDRDEREASMPQHAAMVCRIRARRERARASMLQTAATYRAMANGGTAYARRDGRYAGGWGGGGRRVHVVHSGSLSSIWRGCEVRMGRGARYVPSVRGAAGQGKGTDANECGQVRQVGCRRPRGVRRRWARALGAGAGRGRWAHDPARGIRFAWRVRWGGKGGRFWFPPSNGGGCASGPQGSRPHARISWWGARSSARRVAGLPAPHIPGYEGSRKGLEEWSGAARN